MNKSCLLLLVFWYFNFHIVPESQFQASPANQVSGELCWSKKLHITNSQNNSESHWLSQGSASRRASKGRTVLGYLTEPITQTIFNQPDCLQEKQTPHPKQIRLMKRIPPSLINTEHQAGGVWGSKLSWQHMWSCCDLSHSEEEADFLSRWQVLLLLITDLSLNTWTPSTNTLKHHLTGWKVAVKFI